MTDDKRPVRGDPGPGMWLVKVDDEREHFAFLVLYGLIALGCLVLLLLRCL